MTNDGNADTSPGAPVPTPDPDSPATLPVTPNEPGAPPSLSGVADGGSSNALARLLEKSPFTDLHERAGGSHPFRGAVCFACDFLMRLCVVALLVAIIGAVAWKTLAPLPAFWH